MAQDDIQGQVVDGSGNPVSGAIVELTKSYQSSPTGQEAVQRTTTDSNGNYIFTGHPDGDGTTQEWHVAAYSHDGTAYVNSFNNPGVTADLPSNAIPDSGVLRYDFEDDSNTSSFVDSFSSNTGTNHGATFSSTSKFDSLALDLDGTDDYGEHPTLTALGPSDTWSLSVFARLQTLPSTAGNVFYLWHPRAQFDYSLKISDGSDALSANEFGIRSFDGSPNDVGSGFIVTTGSYIQFGVSSDGTGSYDLVVNGTIENTGSLPDPNTTSDTNVFGGRPGLSSFGDWYFDRFDFYSKQLSSTEWSNLNSTGSING